MSAKNLIIARCGDKSLHMNWLKNGNPDFDLIVTFYGDVVPEAWANTKFYYEIEFLKGSKWRGLYDYMKKNESWKNYEYILFPDDDLLCSARDLNGIFSYAHELGADLCQPALDINSYFSHFITLKHASFNYRYTNFVELMTPCMSRRMVEATLDLFDETESGWGMDFYWSKLIEENDFLPPVIIDDITITHTRPVGSANSGVGSGLASPRIDLQSLCQKLAFIPAAPINLGGKLRNHEGIVSIGTNDDLYRSALLRDTISLSSQVDIGAQVKYIQQNLFNKI